MTPKEKAGELVLKFLRIDNNTKEWFNKHIAKQCAIVAIENEYYSLREMLFNLASSRVIENNKVYLSRIDELIKIEKEIKQEIENL